VYDTRVSVHAHEKRYRLRRAVECKDQLTPIWAHSAKLDSLLTHNILRAWYSQMCRSQVFVDFERIGELIKFTIRHPNLSSDFAP